MQLTIIIPVYNVEKYVEKCIRSCAEQDIPSSIYEIIVINDGSTDNSLSIVNELANEYFNITIFSQQNSGLSSARNKGLSLANGEYVWFVDSDDFIEKNCLKYILNKLESNRLDILGITAANIINQTIKRRFSFPIKYEETINKGRDILLQRLEQTCVPFSIYNRKFLLKNELYFFVGIFHEDLEFTPRAYYLAEKVQLINNLIYYVNQNPHSITRTVNSKKSFDIIKVCICLDLFIKNVDKKYKRSFNNLISKNINNALFNSYSLEFSETIIFNLELDKGRYLFKHLLKSSIIKYKIEGILFKVFRGKYVQTYKLIQKLNNR